MVAQTQNNKAMFRTHIYLPMVSDLDYIPTNRIHHITDTIHIEKSKRAYCRYDESTKSIIIDAESVDLIGEIAIQIGLAIKQLQFDLAFEQ